MKAPREIWVLNAPVSFEPDLAQLHDVTLHRTVATGDRIAFGVAFAITQAGSIPPRVR